ncbi:23S rRNA pseudouridine synthase F [Fictibacillus phosphorivorans]|uniref:Pseudouridine synthase n=1 Tax=Fictibacillus phosphorivorans TaxID=1221500 RepID=A0A161SY64_9BACL|nr:pseudouridine synthase [Fictibacillus phosphorivorans]KZE63763.1 23S rRNA pseudouridine synthase F [Fictibacillus phosphorivorans]
MRIHKYISTTGYCSRRETKRLLESGRITVNGETANKDTFVNEGDIVLIDGESLPQKAAAVYVAFNKPVGITSTSNPEIEGNILELVDLPERVFAVGRLDKASQGLILLTNDGEFANRISQADFGHEKEYEVTVDQPITDLFLQKMAQGVPILNTVTKPSKTELVSKYVFRITLTQGLNRQIRRMCKALGYEVEKLERIRIMNIHLHALEVGKWRYLRDEELYELKKCLELL